jgi:hypothetical protein
MVRQPKTEKATVLQECALLTNGGSSATDTARQPIADNKLAKESATARPIPWLILFKAFAAKTGNSCGSPLLSNHAMS